MMDCKLNEKYHFMFLFENIYFRWHQIILRFGYQSVRLQFDNQLDNEIELPLSLIRTSGKFNITKVAFLGGCDHRENQTDSFFKVKLRNRFSFYWIVTRWLILIKVIFITVIRFLPSDLKYKENNNNSFNPFYLTNVSIFLK